MKQLMPHWLAALIFGLPLLAWAVWLAVSNCGCATVPVTPHPLSTEMLDAGATYDWCHDSRRSLLSIEEQRVLCGPKRVEANLELP